MSRSPTSSKAWTSPCTERRPTSRGRNRFSRLRLARILEEVPMSFRRIAFSAASAILLIASIFVHPGLGTADAQTTLPRESMARFDGPRGVAIDSGGNVYVADYFGNSIRKIAPAGVGTRFGGAGGVAGGVGGNGREAPFGHPVGLGVVR